MKNIQPLQRGVVVFAILAVLTTIEYFLAISEVPQILLWTVALIKLVLVLQYFMHVYRVFRSDEGDSE
ncbi:MAG: hypothetical protein BGO78_15605 [Chloroflexi bacterium 44-23]|nr:MAG: hypothetical protein BGO78_15605 [Chloroflexi bacterium 44-23]